MRLPLPALFQGWSLEVVPAGPYLSWGGTAGERGLRSRATLCLELSSPGGRGVRRVLWVPGVGWSSFSQPQLSSWSLAGPLAAEVFGSLPEGLEEAVLDAAPGRDDMVALEVMES